MTIDAHQHFWRYNANEYPWIKAGTLLERDWLPTDLIREAQRSGIHGSIAVQARQTLEESRWLLRLADESRFIKGVVGWVDLRAERVDEDLAPLARHKKFVGVRHVVQDEADPEFMLKPEFLRGIAKLKPLDLTYDLLIFPKQLPAAIKLVRQFPEQPFVVDHIAKPVIRAGLLKPWREDLQELAKNPNVYCKISGLITEGKLVGWHPEDFRPYLDVVIKAFGEHRVMFGSDWPVCLLAGKYAQVHSLVANYFHAFSAETQRAFFGQTAASFYGV